MKFSRATEKSFIVGSGCKQRKLAKMMMARSNYVSLGDSKYNFPKS